MTSTVDRQSIPEGSFINDGYYLDPAIFEREMHEVFPRSWVFVGDTSSLRSPGDYVTETVGSIPIVVVVDKDATLRAFVNVCTHRASTIAEGAGNCGRVMTCPYHGWIFGLDGALLGAPMQSDLQGVFNRAELGLAEIRLAVWEQFVFVNISGDAAPLQEWLAPLPERMAGHDLASLTAVHSLDDTVDVNWKIMIDNAYCDYHLGFVHADSIGQFVEPQAVGEEVWQTTGMVTTRWKDEQLEALDRPAGLVGAAAQGTLGASVCPNFFIAVFPSGGASVMWWTPIDHFQTRARVINYSRHQGDDPRSELKQLQMVQNEDFDICRKVQLGIRSGMYRPGPTHRLEGRIGGFQRWLTSLLDREPGSS